jgi:hypothetical protein
MAPFRKKATTILGEVQQERAGTLARIADCTRRRDDLLLAGDDGGLDVLEAELAGLQKAAARQGDRIHLLEQQAKEEEKVAIGKRQLAHVERFAKKLADADALAAELQDDDLPRVLKKYRQIIELREAARMAFSVRSPSANAAAGAAEGCAMSGEAVKALLAFEFYRISAKPRLGGVPGARGEPSLPGALCPKLELQLQPEKIPPLADVMRQASAFAIKTLRDEITVSPEPEIPATVAPVPSPAAPPPAPANGRADAEANLGALLKRQAELAASTAPDAERQYQAVVAEIATLQ